MEQLSKLAEQGPAWALLIVAIGVIAFLFRQLTKEREACTNDWRSIVAGNTLQMKEWSAANEPRTRALEANVRALEMMTAAITQLASEIGQLRDIIHSRTEEAIQSNRGMREALIKRGVEL